MNEKIKYSHRNRISVFTMLLLSWSMASGQNISDQELYLSRRFQNYTRSVPWEEIYIHTDRDEFIAGEDIWFNAFLINRKSLNPSMNSRIVYFELLNPANNPVVQKSIILDKGLGQGHVTLPDSLVSGTYTIRAYTKWMQNFFPGNCFVRSINIYSSFPSKDFYGKAFIKEKQSGSFSSIPGSGLKMTAERKENGDVEIFVEAPGDTQLNLNNKICLFIQAHGNITYTGSFQPEKGAARFTVPGKTFLPGISQITLFDNLNKVLCNRFVYIPSAEMNQHVALNTPDNFKTREKISLELQFSEALTESLNPCFSLSVTQQTNIAGYPDINDYLTLGTEFGLNPVLTLNGRRISELRKEELDSLLISLKSNWIDWDKILSVESPRFEFQAETFETNLYGRVLDKNFWPALKNEILTMSFPGKTAQFQYAVTDEDGKFNFIIPISGKEKDLIIQTDDISSGYRVLPSSAYSDQIPLTKLIIDSTAAEPLYISNWRLNSQAGRIYGTSNTGEDIMPDTSSSVYKRFYGKPDFTLKMDDYVRLPLMEEVFFELIPRVRMKKTGSGYDIILLDPAGNIMHETPPILMIDGVIIRDAALIGEMNPDIVEMIDVVWNTYLVDAYRFSGIVNVITRRGDFSAGELPPGSLRISYKISEPVSTFISPDYSGKEKRESRIPDFRNTLYWNPAVKPGKDGKVKIEFWTSDYGADYEVNFQGLTGDGEAVSLNKVIKVRSRIIR